MDLEEKVTKGLVIYIQSIDYSLVENCLSTKFLKNPKESLIARILTFSNVQELSDEWNWDEGRDEDCLDSLIGLDEYPEQSGVQYVIQTEQRAIIFYTEEEPLLQEVYS